MFVTIAMLKANQIVSSGREVLILSQPRRYGLIKNCPNERQMFESVIIDRIKPLFGLKSVGRHLYTKTNGSIGLIEEVAYDSEKKVWFYDESVKSSSSEDWTEDILSAMCFRLFFMLPCNLASLRIRNLYDQKHLLSVKKEHVSKSKKEKEVCAQLPQKYVTILIKRHLTIDEKIAQMTGVTTHQGLDNLCQKIEDIIEEINPEYIDLLALVRNRYLKLLSKIETEIHDSEPSNR